MNQSTGTVIGHLEQPCAIGTAQEEKQTVHKIEIILISYFQQSFMPAHTHPFQLQKLLLLNK